MHQPVPDDVDEPGQPVLRAGGDPPRLCRLHQLFPQSHSDASNTRRVQRLGVEPVRLLVGERAAPGDRDVRRHAPPPDRVDRGSLAMRLGTGRFYSARMCGTVQDHHDGGASRRGAPMSVSVLDMSMSLDGYIADPDDFLGGEDGERLHKWAGQAVETGQGVRGRVEGRRGCRVGTSYRRADGPLGWLPRRPADLRAQPSPARSRRPVGLSPRDVRDDGIESAMRRPRPRRVIAMSRSAAPDVAQRARSRSAGRGADPPGPRAARPRPAPVRPASPEPELESSA